MDSTSSWPGPANPQLTEELMNIDGRRPSGDATVLDTAVSLQPYEAETYIQSKYLTNWEADVTTETFKDMVVASPSNSQFANLTSTFEPSSTHVDASSQLEYYHADYQQIHNSLVSVHRGFCSKTTPLIPSLSSTPVQTPATRSPIHLFIARVLRSYPTMMLKRNPLPPFIHSEAYGPVFSVGGFFSKSLSTCMSIAHMFADRTNESPQLHCVAIESERQRFMNEVCALTQFAPHLTLQSGASSSSANAQLPNTRFDPFLKRKQ